MKKSKYFKSIFTILFVYSIFLLVFVSSKSGPQVERLPDKFDNTPPIDINLDGLTEAEVLKKDLTDEQLLAFNKLLSFYSLSDSVIIKSFSEENFGDTSLGCPKKNVNYSQVETPGYKFSLFIEDKDLRDYRISKDLEILADCTQINIEN